MRLIQTFAIRAHIEERMEDTLKDWITVNDSLLLRPPSRTQHHYIRFAFSPEELDYISFVSNGEQDTKAYAEDMFITYLQEQVGLYHINNQPNHRITIYSITKRLFKYGTYALEIKIGVKRV